MYKESTECTRRVLSLPGEYRVYKESTEFTRRVPNVQGKHRKRSCVGPDLSPTQQFSRKGENSPPPHLLIPTHAPTTPLFPPPRNSALPLTQTDLPRPQPFPYPPPYLLIHDRTPPTPLFSPPKRSSSSSAFPLPSPQIARPRPPLPPPFPRPTKNEAGHS